MKFKYIFLLLIAPLFTFVGCDKEDYTGGSTLIPSSPSATMSHDIPASMVEDNVVFPVTITLSEAQIVDILIGISVLDGGTATEGADFITDHELNIPAFSTSGTFDVEIGRDVEIEGTETFSIQVGDSRTANVDFSPQTITVELQNYVSPDLDITYDWEGSAVVDDTVRVFCEHVDLDVYVFDVDGNDLGIYDAATGDCPEHMTFSGMDDGDYYLWANLWYNDIHPSDGSTISFPITATFVQGGLFSESIIQADPINSDDLDYYDGGAVFKPIARVSVSGTSYTIEAL